MAEDRLKWFYDGNRQGFFNTDQGPDGFVQLSSNDEDGLKSLGQGEQVCFDEERGAKEPQAFRVRKL